MVLVGAVVLPHGTMSFDGQGGESEVESCRERYNGLPKELKAQLSGLFNATTKACEKIAALQPDIVILHTPHGVSLSKSIGVYLNDTAKGDALWNGKWDEFKVEVTLDRELASNIIQHFEEDEIDVQGVNCFARTEAPLRWGEVVPLWYLEEQFKKTAQKPRYAVLSQSMKRGGDFGEEKKAIGESLARFIAQNQSRVVLAISGDLSHCHTYSYKENPLYLPDPRWNLPHSNKAVIFDRAVEGWASSCDLSLITSSIKLPTNEKAAKWDSEMASAWLDHATGLQAEALSCGIGGFIVLHGVLSQCEKNVYSEVLGRFAPTYYGMVATVFSLC